MARKGHCSADSDMEAIAEGWLQENAAANRAEAQPFYDALDRLVRNEPEMAWNIIQMMVQNAGSDKILANIAAGPVEDVLAKHGHLLIGRIEAAARKEPVFKKMLGGVWRNAMSEDVWSRLQKVAGPPL